LHAINVHLVERMSVETTNNNPTGDVVSTETALACFFRLGAQNGVYAEVGASAAAT
jgi:hypothetical protein